MQQQTCETLSVAEVAVILGFSEYTIRQRVKSGKLPSIVMGEADGAIRIPRGCVDSLLQTGRVDGTHLLPDPQEYAREIRRQSLQLQLAAIQRELSELE